MLAANDQVEYLTNNDFVASMWVTTEDYLIWIRLCTSRVKTVYIKGSIPSTRHTYVTRSSILMYLVIKLGSFVKDRAYIL